MNKDDLESLSYNKLEYCNTFFQISNCKIQDYNSKINPLTKFELKQFLHDLNLIELPRECILNIQVDSQKFKTTQPFPFFKTENALEVNFAQAIQDEILSISDASLERL